MKNEYEIVNNYVKIYLNRRKENTILITYIDLEDLKKVSKHKVKWFANWQEDIQNYYAEATLYVGTVDGKPKYKRLTLARVIMNCKGKNVVDHIKSNTLDNRKSNLRITKDSNNLKNRKSKNSNNTSGYRNVSWINGYWRVQLQVNGKNKLFKDKFTDVDLAGIFADKMRSKYYREFKGLN